MTLTSGLSIAAGGLANIDRHLALLAHNVSNAGTPGYVREVAVQTAITADGMGLGVRSGPAIRDVSAGLLNEVWRQQSVVSDLQTRGDALKAVEALNGTPGAGDDLASRLGVVRDAFSNLLTNPADQAGQRAVVDAATTLANGLNSLSTSYTAQRQTAQDGARADIDALNQSLSDIGQLSDRIIRLKSMGESTADLENQRDAAVKEVAARIDVKAMVQANGDMLLVSPHGMSLPTRGDSAPFGLAAANMQPGAWYPGGGVPGIMLGGVDVTAQFATGRIAANIALRDQILPGYQAGLDEFAQTLAQRFDAQGLTLFTDATGNVPTGGGVPAQSTYVGFALTIQVNAAITADASLVRDGSHAVAGSPAGASAFTPNPATGPAGFTTMIQRVLDFALGNQAQPNVAQAAPAGAGLGLGGNLNLSFTPPARLGDFATSLVAAQSADSAGAASHLKSEQAVQGALQARFDTATGVDVDAEMAHMVELQNAYAANAKVISAVQAMWDQLLGAVR